MQNLPQSSPHSKTYACQAEKHEDRSRTMDIQQQPSVVAACTMHVCCLKLGQQQLSQSLVQQHSKHAERCEVNKDHQQAAATAVLGWLACRKERKVPSLHLRAWGRSLLAGMRRTPALLGVIFRLPWLSKKWSLREARSIRVAGGRPSTSTTSCICSTSFSPATDVSVDTSAGWCKEQWHRHDWKNQTLINEKRRKSISTQVGAQKQVLYKVMHSQSATAFEI